jgi:hypothetical protein
MEGGKDSSGRSSKTRSRRLSLGDGSGCVSERKRDFADARKPARGSAEEVRQEPSGWKYESIARDNERAGAMLAFGQAVNVHPQFDKAKVILSLDCDFLGNDWPTPLATKLFSKNRHVDSEEDLEKISRLYVVESQFSLTGANAEHRLRMRGGGCPAVRGDLAAGSSAQPSGNDKRAKFLALSQRI